MRSARRLLPIVLVLLAGLGPTATAAEAAFPGRNGVLVAEPLARGTGLVLVRPNGTSARRICTDGALCGRPAAPRFSPDGGSIVFATGTRPGIVATDGTCMWCELGTPLTLTPGSAPAFTADGRTISFSGAGGLWQATLAGVTRALSRAPETQAVWSARGALAFVRAGWIWLVAPGGATRRLTPGTAPNFAPDGRALVFVRAGWIWSLRLAGGAPVRLVRGTAPAPSPDGAELAFIGPRGRVYTAGIRGRHARAVPGLTARSIDWQPLRTPAATPCAIPLGATVIAQTPQAIITSRAAAPGAAPIGCLQATGRRVALAVALPRKAEGPAVPVAVALAGRYALISTVTDAAASTCSAGLTRFDLSSGRATSLYTRACAAEPGGIDSLALDTSGFAAWHAAERVAAPQPFAALTCPAANLCLAVDARGNAARSASATAPAEGWTVAKVAPVLTAVGCHGTTLCVGLSGAAVTVTTDPTNGAGGWSAPAAVDSVPLTDVACPSDGLCVAVDTAGDVVTSTDPAGGAAAWHVANVAGSDALQGVSCPSVHLCVAVGQNGDVVTSTDPAAGAAAWSRSTAESGGARLDGVACPSVSLCVATDSSGHILSTTVPSAGGAWAVTATPAAPGALGRPACPSPTFCIAPDGAGDVIADTNPAAPTPTLTSNHLAATLTAVACLAGTSTCAATDGAGDILSSSDAAGGGAWNEAAVDVPPCGACVAEQVFAVDGRGRQAVDTLLPGPGGRLGAVALDGNATTLTWSDGGRARSFALR